MITSYRIEGMHCTSCIEKIKQALSKYVQVITITLNPPLLQIETESQPNIEALNKYIAVAGKYLLQPSNIQNDMPSGNSLRAYFPIFLIAAYIFGVSIISNFHNGTIHWTGWMNQFMAGFFLVFSAFKFLNLKGFSEGYASYDWLARKWNFYGFIYPFLELGLGILYLGMWFPKIASIITIIIMGFSSLGVIESLLKKQKLRCACLGTLLNVPLSTITLIEDLTMVVLAVISLAL